MTTTDERAEQDFDATSDDMIGRSREEVESHSCWIFPKSNTSNQSHFETSTEISGLNSISFNCRSATHCKISVLGVGRSTAPEGISGVLGEYYTIADGGWDLIWYNNDNVQSYFIHLTQQTRFSTRWRPRNFRLTRTDYLVYWHKIIKPVHSNLLCCTLNAPLRRFGIAPLTSLSLQVAKQRSGVRAKLTSPPFSPVFSHQRNLRTSGFLLVPIPFIFSANKPPFLQLVLKDFQNFVHFY